MELKTAAELILLQTNRQETINRIAINYKKDPASRKTKIYYEKRLEQVEKLHQMFNEAHDYIVCVKEYITSSYHTDDAAEVFEESYMDTYCLIAEDFAKAFPISVPENPNAENHQTVATGSTAGPENYIRMPQMPVPKFSGNCIDWPGYYDAFTRLIHENPQLSNIQKFHFLKESLPVGQDNDILQIQLTDGNYEIALKTLIKRYNNPRIIFSYHMNVLFNLPNLQKEKSEELRTMLSTANVCLAAFQRSHIGQDEENHWLAHLLASKLPKETHIAWENHLGNNTTVPSFKRLEEYLNDRLMTINAIESRKQANAKDTSDSSKRVHVHNTQTKSGLSCFHCKGDHIIRRCPAFLALDEYKRKDIVGKAKLCYNCLSQSHMLQHCTSTKGCSQCGQRHHSLLHITTHQQVSDTQPKSETAQQISSNGGGNNRNCYSSTTACSRVLLATARINIINPINGIQATINVLIDQGSEATIISEYSVQALRLKRRFTSTSIAGLGEDSGKRCKLQVSCMVQATNNSNFSLQIETAYVLTSLTSSLPALEFLPQQWSHIQGLQLADPKYYVPKKIDLIIGADLIAQILLPDIKIGLPNEPIAQHTHFGWILSGKIQPLPVSSY